MKRYTIKTDVSEYQDLMRCRIERRALSIVQESADGEWVRWSDVERLREYLENQIPEIRIERLEKRLGLVSSGKCPECEQPVSGFKPPVGSFAPEMWATLRESGIDPATGHRRGCSLARKS
jgi:hypothetical protein